VLLHARRAVVVINDIAAYYWQGFGRFLATLTPQARAVVRAQPRAVPTPQPRAP
jgi:hypothetical protein